MSYVSEVTKIRRKVLTGVARLVFQNRLDTGIDELIYTIATEEGPRYRCCVHKERAVLKERIKHVLGQSQKMKLDDTIAAAISGKEPDEPIISVLDVACDQCPIDKFIVTDACRNCIAHPCINSCPKKAIVEVQNRAYIDKNKCVECGICKRACPYGAILEISRPCERACQVGAIYAGTDRKAKIDYEKCIQCGACRMGCPFGAISDRTDVAKVSFMLRDKTQHTYAILAPAFIGQFGHKVSPAQIKQALGQLGFYEVREVAEGADVVAIAETKEFIETVPVERKCMTTSCCPAFVALIEKHHPELADYMSSTISPMIAIGKLVKEVDPYAKVVFIGPCLAKKEEARRRENIEAIDAVLTFEELAAIFVAANINVAEMPEDSFTTRASEHGTTFARTGGLVRAVEGSLGKLAASIPFQPMQCNGVEACQENLALIKAGKCNANFIEGMVCSGGCVGGPGTLMDYRVTTRLVDTFAKGAAVTESISNPESRDQVDKDEKKFHRQYNKE
jgi:[FeFe] hydrogenase (group B1/B3)